MTNHCFDSKFDNQAGSQSTSDSGIHAAVHDCYSKQNQNRHEQKQEPQTGQSAAAEGHLDIPDIFQSMKTPDASAPHHEHHRGGHHGHHGHDGNNDKPPVAVTDTPAPVTDTPPPVTDTPAPVTDTPTPVADKPPVVSDSSSKVPGLDKMPVGALTQTLSVLDENPTNLNVNDLLAMKAQGISGVRDVYQLPNDRLLNASELAFLDKDYATARAAGMPMITIFNYTQQAGGADAPADLIKAQLAQVAPILSKNQDTIGAVELGFVGAWGEWNRSTNGNDQNTALAKDIYDGFSKALPDTPVAFRYVGLVRDIFGDNPPANVIMQNDSIGESHGTAYRDKDAGSYLNPGDYEYIVNHHLMTIGENQESGTPQEILQRVQETNITSMHFWGSVGADVESAGHVRIR